MKLAFWDHSCVKNLWNFSYFTHQDTPVSKVMICRVLDDASLQCTSASHVWPWNCCKWCPFTTNLIVHNYYSIHLNPCGLGSRLHACILTILVSYSLPYPHRVTHAITLFQWSYICDHAESTCIVSLL